METKATKYAIVKQSIKQQIKNGTLAIDAKLPTEAEYAEIYSVYDRDVSKVYVYVVDYFTYMEECKGNNYRNLPEKAVYQTEVVF